MKSNRVAKYFVFKRGSSTALGGWSTKEQAEKTARIYATGSGGTFIVRAGGSGKSRLVFTTAPTRSNPGVLHGTVNDIPSTWTPVMVKRIGNHVQIKMRGR